MDDAINGDETQARGYEGENEMEMGIEEPPYRVQALKPVAKQFALKLYQSLTRCESAGAKRE